MNTDEMLDFCLAKKGAYIDFPFGPDCVCVKVKKRIFAQFFTLHGAPQATLNCGRMVREFFLRAYPDAVWRGYHCPPVQQTYFNTIEFSVGLPDEEPVAMMNHSYDYVVGKPSREIREDPEWE